MRLIRRLSLDFYFKGLKLAAQLFAEKSQRTLETSAAVGAVWWLVGLGLPAAATLLKNTCSLFYPPFFAFKSTFFVKRFGLVRITLPTSVFLFVGSRASDVKQETVCHFQGSPSVYGTLRVFVPPS